MSTNDTVNDNFGEKDNIDNKTSSKKKVVKKKKKVQKKTTLSSKDVPNVDDNEEKKENGNEETQAEGEVTKEDTVKPFESSEQTKDEGETFMTEENTVGDTEKQSSIDGKENINYQNTEEKNVNVQPEDLNEVDDKVEENQNTEKVEENEPIEKIEINKETVEETIIEQRGDEIVEEVTKVEQVEVRLTEEKIDENADQDLDNHPKEESKLEEQNKNYNEGNFEYEEKSKQKINGEEVPEEDNRKEEAPLLNNKSDGDEIKTEDSNKIEEKIDNETIEEKDLGLINVNEVISESPINNEPASDVKIEEGVTIKEEVTYIPLSEEENIEPADNLNVSPQVFLPHTQENLRQIPETKHIEVENTNEMETTTQEEMIPLVEAESKQNEDPLDNKEPPAEEKPVMSKASAHIKVDVQEEEPEKIPNTSAENNIELTGKPAESSVINNEIIAEITTKTFIVENEKGEHSGKITETHIEVEGNEGAKKHSVHKDEIIVTSAPIHENILTSEVPLSKSKNKVEVMDDTSSEEKRELKVQKKYNPSFFQKMVPLFIFSTGGLLLSYFLYKRYKM